jgi:hypothetical protein
MVQTLDGTESRAMPLLRGTRETSSAGLGEGNAVTSTKLSTRVAAVHVFTLVDHLHARDEFFDEVAELGDTFASLSASLVVLVVGADVEDLALDGVQGGYQAHEDGLGPGGPSPEGGTDPRAGISGSWAATRRAVTSATPSAAPSASSGLRLRAGLGMVVSKLYRRL